MSKGSGSGATAKDKVDAFLHQVWRMQGDGDSKYESVSLNDDSLRAKLLRVAANRELTLPVLDLVLAEIEKEASENLSKLLDTISRCKEQRDDLRVFYVVNTADRRLTVFARDVQCARHIAHLHGHIQEEKNGRVFHMKPEDEAALRKSGSALARALRAGHPGVVTQLGDNVVMESSNKVYTPMTIVD